MNRRSKPELQLEPKQVDGPLSREAYFARRPPAVGARPCRRLGLGTAWLGALYGKPRQHQAVDTLHTAWRDGFELVDTAPGYGPAELLVSEALASWRGDRPIIATKTKQRNADLDGVIEEYTRSVERLGKIDLLAVHDPLPGFSDESRAAISDYLAKLLDEGQIAAAGLGGGGPVVQAQWLDAGIYRYVITFNRLGALSLQALEDTVPRAKQAVAAVFAASPLFMGLLGARQAELFQNLPDHYAPVFVERAKAAIRLAQAASMPLSQLAIRFLLSMPAVDVVLAGAACPSEWTDVQAAYEAGPLPDDLYAKVWQIAQQGPEPVIGG